MATAKTRSQCTAEEALRYLQHYFATVDLIAEALGKYEVLATDASTAAARSSFRAQALEAERDLELLKNQRRAFLAEEAAIKPPSDAAVATAEERTASLAEILAKEANSAAIIALATKGLAAFNKIHAA
jgi:hypothetical protein